MKPKSQNLSIGMILPDASISIHTTMESTRILLCDDHALMRGGITSTLKKQEWIDVVGTVDNGIAAINFVSRIATDIVLMDIVMTGMSGIEATRWIKEQSPNVKVILVSGEATSSSVIGGIKAGADGYVLKHSSEDQLVKAIQKVRQGDCSYGLEVISVVSKEIDNKNPLAAKNTEQLDTTRMFLKLLISGMPMENIESTLSLPQKSGQHFYKEVMSKLGLKCIADAIRYSILHNIVKI